MGFQECRAGRIGFRVACESEGILNPWLEFEYKVAAPYATAAAAHSLEAIRRGVAAFRIIFSDDAEFASAEHQTRQKLRLFRR